VTPTRAALGMAAAGLLACSACSKPSAPDPTGPGPSPVLAPLASAPPADHLGPDELIEGPDRAFGVALPRGLTVEQRFPDVVYASGPMTVHALVLFFRPRLTGGALRESATVATFEHARAPGMGPNTDLTIHLAVTLGKTRVDISSMIYPPAPALPDEAARWKQVGLTPEGKILDPTHLD
jgi:hypothetical protein